MRKKKTAAEREASKDFIILATGPSLTQEDCDRAVASDYEVIAINDAYRLCPDADYLYACDKKWWVHHLPLIRESGFKGTLHTQYEDKPTKAWALGEGIVPHAGRHGPGIGHEQIHYNSNSGAQAINLAFLWGARRLLLVGFNMCYPMVDGKPTAHFFGDHPNGWSNGRYEAWVGLHDQIAEDLREAGVEVINCTTPPTHLDQYPRMTLEEAL